MRAMDLLLALLIYLGIFYLSEKSPSKESSRASCVKVVLGVRDLKTLINALLCKWNWCFVAKRGMVWRNFICWKCGEEGGGGW